MSFASFDIEFEAYLENYYTIWTLLMKVSYNVSVIVKLHVEVFGLLIKLILQLFYFSF